MKKTLKTLLSSTIFKYILYAVASFFSVFGYNKYFLEGNFLGNESILNVVLFVTFFCLLKYAFGRNNQCKTLVYSGIFSLLLSVSLLWGHTLYVKGDFSEILGTYKTIIKALISLTGFTFTIQAVFLVIFQSLSKADITCAKPLWKIWKHPLLLTIPIFLCWLPCYLAYYPGIFSYDMYDQTPQAFGVVSLSKYHPPLHTLFWKLCLVIEQHIGFNALVLYSILQMLLLAFAFAYILKFMTKKEFSNGLLLGTLLFFCLNPVIAIFSFVPAKDVLFTATFSVFTIELFQFTETCENKSQSISSSFMLITFGILSCLLRNNAFFALIPALLVILLLARKQWKKIVLSGACILLGYTLINGPLFTAMGIDDGNSREMLSVPIQQISYVVTCHESEISQSDSDAIANYLPLAEIKTLYNPRLADPVKITFKTENFQESPSDFIKLWFRLFTQYPKDYVIAFLNLNLPYWYPDASTVDPYANRAYIETYIYDASVTGYEVTRDSKIPLLYSLYEKVASYDLFKTLPIVSNIFSISTPIWLLVTVIFFLLLKKEKALLIPIMPAFFLWCTYMLGPVSNFRYMFPIMVLYPLFIAIVLQSKSKI